MISDIKRMVYNNSLLTGSISSELDDDDVFPSLNEFDLPLKAKVLRSRNFSELSGDQGEISKKVRFENTDDSSGTTDSYLSDDIYSESDHSKIGPIKASIEELLRNADEYNQLTEESLSGKALSRILSNVPPGTATFSETLSNFDLSDNELDGNYRLDPVSSYNTENSLDNILLDDALSGTENGPYHSSDTTSNSRRSTPLSNGTINNSPSEINKPFEIDQELSKFHALNIKSQPTFGSQDMDHLLYNKDKISLEQGYLLVEDAIITFEETISLLLTLSRENTNGILSPQAYKPDLTFDTFIMKNTPSLSYFDFIQRIQNKCMFGSVVYQSATWLLQLLFLQRESIDEPLKLKHQLQENEIHRIIIATIRIATKLIEDHIHSHQYFCKVCGISKRLLSKLEVTLLLCLKDEALMITSEKLAASVQILNELKSYL
ncbi:hypothetical protein KAFR_0K00180 [Kazachstania africana CBS 2517]|uniref:Uncharacterized protein n=1 Tax=Kazachstania africana (strain ATCC 22294 / BCRC 22015 / CBS 2517 / CECT 1963 / NBRC 1671 / NRRL Y-8276) TaxID=1071382 RepID=H2B173_KAZAF|nr:hypothetical protein KAFR_0K00180 [Kazachstania africana CBS 2517]CCF60373.1 hypothetical protein KAFR_0K00180 [Kazachstania africana CBS 2517]